MTESDRLLFSRRLFLTRGVQLLSAASTLPLFLDRSARCLAAEYAANPQGAGRNSNILVVLQLAGGNDGLNTVIPFTNDHYQRARPKLGVARNEVLPLTADFGFHPKAIGLKKLYDDGLMGVIHATGYPNPNRSHFRSTDIWASAEPTKVSQSGWIGRYFDACCSGQDPTPRQAEPSTAVALTNDPPQALSGEKFLPIAFRNTGSLQHRGTSRDAKLTSAFDKLNDVNMPAMKGDEHATAPAGQAAEDFLERSALNARVYAEEVRKSTASIQNKATYPGTQLATDLKLVSQMIAAEMPTRVYYVQLGGFDTHANQAARHSKLMEDLGGAVAAFITDLKALGHLDRVTLMTFSEFGRRVAENASGGTDHGEAAPMFVIGSRIRPGTHGTFPDLAPAVLHRGDVPFTTDFRRVYSSMLKTWLGADDVRVLGQKFDPLSLFRAT